MTMVRALVLAALANAGLVALLLLVHALAA